MNFKALWVLLLLMVSMGFAYNTSYWIHGNNSAIPTEIWARENLSATPYTTVVYYAGSANFSNGSLVFDFFDDAQVNRTASYTIASGNWGWNATSKTFYINTSGTAFIYPSVQGNLTNDYVIESDVRYSLYDTGGADFEYGARVCGFADSIGSITTGYCPNFDPSFTHGGITGLSIFHVNVDYFNTVPTALALSKNIPLRGRFSNGLIQANITRPENNTMVDTSYSDSTFKEGYFFLSGYSSLADFDNIRAYKYCQAPSISYGAETLGSFNVSGVVFPKSRQITITAASTLPNCTFELDYNYFNSTELAISNETPTSASNTSATLVPPTPSDNSVNISLFANATITNADACTLYANSTPYAMTMVGIASCYLNQSLSDGNYSYYVYAYNSSNPSANGSSTTRNIIIDNTAPSSLNLSSPANFTKLYQNATLNVSYFDLSSAHCIITVNGTNYTMGNITSQLCQYQLNNSIGNFGAQATIIDMMGHLSFSNNVSFSIFNITNVSATYTASIGDVASDYQTLTINMSNYGLNLSVNYEFNGTNYTPTVISSTGNDFVYAYNLTAPIVTAIQSFKINWYYSTLNATPVGIYNFTYNITISPVNISDCSILYSTPFLNFTFYDQESPTTSVNSTMDATFYLRAVSGGTDKNFSFNWTTPVPFISLCINATSGNYTLDSIQQYTASGYRNLFYYLLNASINIPTMQNVSLYNLNSSISTATKYSIYTGANQPVTDAYLQIYRFYPATNQMLLVSMGKTDVQGTAQSYAVPNEVIYRYVVIRDYQIRFTSTSATLPCDPAATLCTQTILYDSEVQNEYTAFFNNVAVGCYVDNATTTIFCTSNDPSGTGSKIELYVYEIQTYGRNLTCYNSIASGSGTVSCTFDPTKKYAYYGTATIGSIVLLGSGEIGFNARQLFGLELGAFVGIGLIIALATIGFAFGVSAGVVMTYLGVLLSALAGFINIGLLALTSLGVIVFVIVFITRR